MKPKNEDYCASYAPAIIPWFSNRAISSEHSLLFIIIVRFLTSLVVDIKMMRNRAPRINPKKINMPAEICRNCLI